MAATGLLAAAAVDPTVTAVTAAAFASGAQLAGQLPERIGGRVWLSVRERALAASWATGATGWAVGTAADWWHVASGVGVGVLAAAVGVQSVQWARSRRVRPRPEIDDGMSEQARALVAAWPWTIGQHGPKPLLGSAIAAATMTEPDAGTYAFGVDLGADVHTEDAVGAEMRRAVERALRLPVGTVELGVDRDDSGRVLVTLSPSRHLEGTPAPWLGPILHADGTISLALERGGKTICAALHNEAGVEHAGIFGTTGTGKSNSLATMLLPGVATGREVVWYVDGGMGTSASHLAGACDWWAVEGVEEWRTVIHAAHRVMRARKDRRRKLGLSAWRGAAETDPILTLAIDEATTVVLELGKDTKTVEMVMELLREGRKLGVRVIQLAQDPMGDDLIGGRKARGLMAGGGCLIGHRPGDGVANVLAGGGSSTKVNLLALPGEAGWVAVIRRGQVLTHAARISYAREDVVIDLLAGLTLRTLVGPDAEVAGSDYTNRIRGISAAAELAGLLGADHQLDDDQTVELEQVDDDKVVDLDTDGADHQDEIGAQNVSRAAQRAEDATTVLSVQAVLSAIRTAGPLNRPQLMQRTGLSKSTVQRAVGRLTTAGTIERADSDQGWVLTSGQAVA